ncbi:Bug family tripartite tricarboxylate transporter substrate binding protein [Azohydromonas australica]|uniref:Bug family tripartite tricarboxylate transporter substrate binding protein n=1 Tax=Azohydromonas australica TaxID=364039 RepID=UPI000408B58C|nr:tripartite tricarboxylate transporter substrate binding protein [Azohydromonas australica]
MKLQRRFAMLGIAGFALGACGLVHADAYPSKPVRMVIPYAAGGPVDALGRALASRLSAAWGQQVIVDNRPGGNEVIAASQVAKAGGDGYTLMLATDPTLSLNPYLFQKLSYDPIKDFTPITRVAISNMALVVANSLPANTLKDFVAYVRANPDKVSYGSSGVGNGTHLSMAWFAKENQLNMVHVPYKGLAPALQDMLGGQVQATIGAVSVVMPFVESGKIKVLAISGDKRAQSLPNVPTFAQAGFPAMQASFYYGLIAPAGLPAAIRDKIAADVRAIVADEKFRKANLDTFALEPVADSPQEFAQFLVRDREMAMSKVKLSGARLD